MKLIKFKTSGGVKYIIYDIKLNGKTFRSGYDKSLRKLLGLWKETKFSNTLIACNKKPPFYENRLWVVEFNEVEDLFELIPEEFL